MPFVERDGAQIHWSSLEPTGPRGPQPGDPVVLIMGLGCTSAMWFRLAPLLARQHRVILLDNRGVGRTEVRHAVVHRVTTMAADVAAVLDAAGAPRAHIVGLSMGGMIAQQFAIDFAPRVRSLTLMATHCGGAHAVLAERHVWQMLFRKGEQSPEAALTAMRPYTYARNTPDEVIAADQLVRLTSYPTLRGYQAQLYGLMGWSSYHHLPRLRCPTLVLHGLEDRLIPPDNARTLARRIAGARLVEMPAASHWLHSDQPERTAAEVLTFLAQHQPA